MGYMGFDTGFGRSFSMGFGTFEAMFGIMFVLVIGVFVVTFVRGIGQWNKNNKIKLFFSGKSGARRI